jgi:hypothetical protein
MTIRFRNGISVSARGSGLYQDCGKTTASGIDIAGESSAASASTECLSPACLTTVITFGGQGDRRTGEVTAVSVASGKDKVNRDMHQGQCISVSETACDSRVDRCVTCLGRDEHQEPPCRSASLTPSPPCSLFWQSLLRRLPSCHHTSLPHHPPAPAATLGPISKLGLMNTISGSSR